MKRKTTIFSGVTVLRNYELMLALKPLLPDDVRKAMHKEFVEQVAEFGGEVSDVDVWGKRYLAYPIAGHTEAYYVVYNFKASASSIAELKRRLSLKTDILRFMITKVQHPELIGKGIKKKEIID